MRARRDGLQLLAYFFFAGECAIVFSGFDDNPLAASPDAFAVGPICGVTTIPFAFWSAI